MHKGGDHAAIVAVHGIAAAEFRSRRDKAAKAEARLSKGLATLGTAYQASKALSHCNDRSDCHYGWLRIDLVFQSVATYPNAQTPCSISKL
jgi:hypothetical protein